nr:MAG TPA: hypothetical protein [Caudoviricetes sp.]
MMLLSSDIGDYYILIIFSLFSKGKCRVNKNGCRGIVMGRTCT